MQLSSSKSSKRFPNLAAYLKAVVEKRIYRANVIAALRGGTAVWSAVTLVAVAAWFLTGEGIGQTIVAAVAALPASAFAFYFLYRKARAPKTPAEEKRRQAWRAASLLHSLETQRRLHKRLDPSISQLLEAACFHFNRVQIALEAGYWKSENLPAHWAAVRSQASDAAEQAMEELLLLAEPCTGEPQTNKGRAIKEVMEDLLELDIGDALGGLKEIANSDWTRYAHRSPHAPIAFESGRSIAEKLKRLADEVEAKGREAAIQAGEPMIVPSSADTIDIVLGEIASVKEAEGELKEKI